MFPDGGMAKNLQCGSTKASYVTTFDLTPSFHSLLFLNISSSPHQVVSIDESLNNSVQERQMALLIRYWDNNTDIVCTCYMESKFIGSSTAEHVLETFQNKISKVDESKFMQVSFDGPNANLAFLKKYISLREKKELDPLIDLGTCGLHLVHASIKTGTKTSEWELQKLFKAMWQFIRVAPARR